MGYGAGDRAGRGWRRRDRAEGIGEGRDRE